MRQTVVLAALAALALLGLSCSPPAGTYYPLSVDSVWKTESYALRGTTLAALDTVLTGTELTTALEKATHSNGKEVIKFKTESTTRLKNPDTTWTYTSYSFLREENEVILGYSTLDDSTADTVLVQDLSVGKTWNQHGVTYTVVAEENVTVQAGTYKQAAKVKVPMSSGGFSYDMFIWFAKGTGLVQTKYEYTNAGVTSKYHEELTEVTIK